MARTGEGGLDDLVGAATARALEAAATGADLAVRLRLGDLRPGQVGLVEAEVRTIGPVRTYTRKRGGEGLLQRVTLADASGEAELVLWDDEVRLTKDGPLQPGAHVRIHGPQVKAGRGCVELGATGAEVVALPGGGEQGLRGRLTAIGPTRPVGDPPALRFTCELVLETDRGPVRMAAWDAAVKGALAAGLGAAVRIRGRPNPFLDGWWTCTALERDAAGERNP